MLKAVIKYSIFLCTSLITLVAHTFELTPEARWANTFGKTVAAIT
jgi:hypothetical protein